MAKENKNVVEEVANEVTEQPTEEKVEQQVDESKFDSAGDDSVIKVDLSQPPPVKEEVVEEKTNVVSEESKTDETKEAVEEPQKDTPILEEVTDEEVAEAEEQIEEVISESEATGKPLPENVQKLVDFMDETGGDLNDYVNLNRDTSKMDDSEVLDEYYRETKSHLTPEERGFLLEDSFGIDEEVDDEREIRKKKIALKEQVAMAKSHLDGQKSKYYEDIKAGSKLTQEQQKAIDFFNSHTKKSEEQNKILESNKKDFKQKTDKVFNDKFKGFDYQVGDKKFRFNVKNSNEVKDTQSSLDNFINKFVGEDSTMNDAKGYHKSLFTAMNADAVANHFYEQGKADAIKGQIAKDKNIDMKPRQSHGEVEASGIKVRVLGDTANDFKFKIKK